MIFSMLNAKEVFVLSDNKNKDLTELKDSVKLKVNGSIIIKGKEGNIKAMRWLYDILEENHIELSDDFEIDFL